MDKKSAKPGRLVRREIEIYQELWWGVRLENLFRFYWGEHEMVKIADKVLIRNELIEDAIRWY